MSFTIIFENLCRLAVSGSMSHHRKPEGNLLELGRDSMSSLLPIIQNSLFSLVTFSLEFLTCLLLNVGGYNVSRHQSAMPSAVEHQRVFIQSYDLNGLVKNSLTSRVLISKAEPSEWKKLKHHHATVQQGGFSPEFHMERLRFRTLPLESSLFDPYHLQKLPVNSRKTNQTFLTLHSFFVIFSDFSRIEIPTLTIISQNLNSQLLENLSSSQ